MDIFNFVFRVTQRPPSVRPTEEGNRRRSLLFSTHSLSRLLCALCFLVLSNACLAEAYYWKVGDYSDTSPLAACTAYFDDLGKNFTYPIHSINVQFSHDTQGFCHGISYGQQYVGTIYRFGDSCPLNGVYNSATGICDVPNLCESTNGQTILHQHKVSTSVGQPHSEPPGSVCANSCKYSWGYTPANNCYAYTSGDPSGVFCSYQYVSAGFQCTGGESPWEAPASTEETINPDETPPPDDTSQCPTGYTFNGTFCSPNTPTDPTDPTDPADPTDPGGTDPRDGSGDGGADDGGDDGGSGHGGGSGDGDGEKPGTCDPATDPSKCVVSSVGGEACTASLVCTGDAIQCAVLRQQKAMRCNDEKMADYESNKANIENMFKGDKFELDEQEVEVPSFINTATRFLPSACPQPLTASTSGGTFGYSFEPACELASTFSWIFVALAALWAAVYVGAAFGGNE